MVLSSASEEEEEDPACETDGLQIERVLHSRPSAADPKQQEFLVKFHGETMYCKTCIDD